jgi:hypothetical protein
LSRWEGDPSGKWATAVVVAALLALQFCLAESSQLHVGPTFDEAAHLPAGVTYWQTGSFRLYHHNPPLVKLVAAIPVVLAGPEMGSIYQSASWRSVAPSAAGVGYWFAELNAGRYFELFWRARALMPLFATLGGLAVFAWSARLYGRAGGLLSLALWCLCPNVLAHARLVTTDVPAAALAVGATYLHWRSLRRPSWGWAAASGVVLGLAQLTKFSLLLLYVIWPAMWLARELAEGSRADRVRRLARSAARGAMVACVSVLVIDMGYGFEGVGVPLGRFNFASATLTRPGRTPHTSPNERVAIAWKHRINWFWGTPLAAIPAPLPEHYLLGFDEQKLESEGLPMVWLDPSWPNATETTGYSVFFDGVMSRHGRADFYPKLLAYKTPEGTLALMAATLLVTVGSRRTRISWPDEVTLWAVPAAILAVLTATTDLQMGVRYVLPAFPFAFVAAGRLAPWAQGLMGWRRAAAAAGIGAALVATAAAIAGVHPHYLAFFNWASGGPSRGSEHVVESNLDWGQDLVGLRDWLAAHPGEGPIGLAYFGQVHPGLFTIRGEGFPWFLPPARRGTVFPRAAGYEGPRQALTPGLYAVSLTLVRGVPALLHAPGDPQRDPSLLGGPAWRAEQGAFSYFADLRPFAFIGHSIALYRVTPREARRINAQESFGAQDG